MSPPPPGSPGEQGFRVLPAPAPTDRVGGPGFGPGPAGGICSSSSPRLLDAAGVEGREPLTHRRGEVSEASLPDPPADKQKGSKWGKNGG